MFLAFIVHYTHTVHSALLIVHCVHPAPCMPIHSLTNLSRSNITQCPKVMNAQICMHAYNYIVCTYNYYMNNDITVSEALSSHIGGYSKGMKGGSNLKS